MSDQQYFDVAALVPVAAPALATLAAPLDLLYGHELAFGDLGDASPDGDDLAGELVADHDRSLEVVGQNQVVVVVGLEHVHVGAADSAGADLDNHLAGPRGTRVCDGLQAHLRVAVGLVGVERPLALRVLFGDGRPRAGCPLGLENDCLHQGVSDLDLDD